MDDLVYRISKQFGHLLLLAPAMMLSQVGDDICVCAICCHGKNCIGWIVLSSRPQRVEIISMATWEQQIVPFW